MIKAMFTPGIRILWFILVLMFLGYALMIYMVGSGTFSFAIWLAGAAFFGLCFFMSGNGRWAAVPTSIRYSAYIVLVIVAAIFFVCQIAILSHFGDKGEKNLDYVIVLGAQMRSGGPSVVYRYRLDKAKDYLDENPDTICITTGGQGKNEQMSEGLGGSEYLVKLGVPKDRIIAETKSLDTQENIKNALELIETNEGSTNNLSIGIVTNGFHVFRGVRLAKKLTDAEVCGIAAYMTPQYVPNNMLRETFGILRDFFTGKL